MHSAGCCRRIRDRPRRRLPAPGPGWRAWSRRIGMLSMEFRCTPRRCCGRRTAALPGVCVENRIFDPAKNPDGLERDAYDACIRCMRCCCTAPPAVVGTVRPRRTSRARLSRILAVPRDLPPPAPMRAGFLAARGRPGNRRFAISEGAPAWRQPQAPPAPPAPGFRRRPASAAAADDPRSDPGGAANVHRATDPRCLRGHGAEPAAAAGALRSALCAARAAGRLLWLAQPCFANLVELPPAPRSSSRRFGR